jgi:hypothetical protein
MTSDLLPELAGVRCTSNCSSQSWFLVIRPFFAKNKIFHDGRRARDACVVCFSNNKSFVYSLIMEGT